MPSSDTAPTLPAPSRYTTTKPIFYSLGNFIFQNDTVRWQPAYNYESVGLGPEHTPADFYDRRSENDARGFPGDPIYWHSVVARCEYRAHKLRRVTLHPIDLGHDKPSFPARTPRDGGREGRAPQPRPHQAPVPPLRHASRNQRRRSIHRTLTL